MASEFAFFAGLITGICLGAIFTFAACLFALRRERSEGDR